MSVSWTQSTTATGQNGLPAASSSPSDTACAASVGDLALYAINLGTDAILGSYADSSIVYVTGGANAGWTLLGSQKGTGATPRATVIWGKVLTASDISSGKMKAVQCSSWTNTGTGRQHLVVKPLPAGETGWDLTWAKTNYSGHAANAGSGEQTAHSITKPARQGLAFVVANLAGDNSLVHKFDGDTTGTEPYFNEGTAAADTTGATHYGTNANTAQSGWKEYASGDSGVTLKWSSGMNNTTHSSSLVFVPVAAPVYKAGGRAHAVADARARNRATLKTRGRGDAIADGKVRLPGNLKAGGRGDSAADARARNRITAKTRGRGDAIADGRGGARAGSAPPSIIATFATTAASTATTPTSGGTIFTNVGDLAVIIAEYELGAMPTSTGIAYNGGGDAGYDLHGTVTPAGGTRRVRIWSKVLTDDDLGVFGASFLSPAIGPAGWTTVTGSRWQLVILRHARGWDADPAQRLVMFAGHVTNVSNGTVFASHADLDAPLAAVVGLGAAQSTIQLTYDSGTPVNPLFDEIVTGQAGAQADVKLYGPADTAFAVAANISLNNDTHAFAVALFQTKPPQKAGARGESIADARAGSRAVYKAGGRAHAVADATAKARRAQPAGGRGDTLASGSLLQPSPIKRARGSGNAIGDASARARVVYKVGGRADTVADARGGATRLGHEAHGDTIGWAYGIPRVIYKAGGRADAVGDARARQVSATQHFAGGRGPTIADARAGSSQIKRAGGLADAVADANAQSAATQSTRRSTYWSRSASTVAGISPRTRVPAIARGASASRAMAEPGVYSRTPGIYRTASATVARGVQAVRRSRSALRSRSSTLGRVVANLFVLPREPGYQVVYVEARQLVEHDEQYALVHIEQHALDVVEEYGGD